MAPTGKQHWPRQSQPWTRSDESDEEDAQAAKKRWLLRRRERTTRRKNPDSIAAGQPARQLVRRQEPEIIIDEPSEGTSDGITDGISGNSSDSSESEGEAGGGDGRPGVPPSVTVALPGPSSAPVFIPPPPPSATTGISSANTPAPRPTTFRPMPEPSVSRRRSSEAQPESTTEPSVGAPLTTVTVGDDRPTSLSLSIPTSTATETTTLTTPVLVAPVLPSEVRKGVERTTDSADGPGPTADPFNDYTPADRIENNPGGHRDGHRGPPPGTHTLGPSHKAMHVLGSIGGVVIFAALVVLGWWYFKKYRPKKRRERGNLPLPPPPPSRLQGFLGKFLPIGKFSNKSTQDREWRIESAPSAAPALDEKDMQLELGQQYAYRQGGDATGEQYLPPVQFDSSAPPTYADANGTNTWANSYIEKDGRTHAPNQPSMSSITAQPNNTLRINAPYYKRTSEVSSLSSGFGDGEMPMAPSTAHNTMDEAGLTQLAPPPPTANPRRFSARTESTSRDTWYTEASEDQPARFRTINSWVRQQTGRIKREKQRRADSDVPPVPALPVEEEYRMMMPDGEEPRRVDMNMDVGAAYREAR